MRHRISTLLCFTALAGTLSACGPSMGALRRTAENRQINHEAPVLVEKTVLIKAAPERVWELLHNASAWPTWHKGIESVSAETGLTPGRAFRWKVNGTEITSNPVIVDKHRYLSWTGEVMWFKAIHAWELKPEGDYTRLTVRESMDGFLIGLLYGEQNLEGALDEWITYLRKTAEG